MNEYLRQLALVAPEVALTTLALVVLVWDLVTKGRDSRQVGYVTLGGLAVVGWILLGQWRSLTVGSAGASGVEGATAFGMMTLDRFGVFFKLFTVGALGIVITAAFIVWAIQRVFFGKLNEKYRHYEDLTPREIFCQAPFLALCVILGVMPWFLTNWMEPSIDKIVRTLGG